MTESAILRADTTIFREFIHSSFDGQSKLEMNNCFLINLIDVGGEAKAIIRNSFIFEERFGLVQTGSKADVLIEDSIVGAIGAVINLAILYLLTDLYGLYYLISGAISIELTILSNFFINRAWTFTKKDLLLERLLKDHITRISGVIVKLFCLFALTEFGLYHIYSMAIGIAFGMFFNYAGNTLWVWRK